MLTSAGVEVPKDSDGVAHVVALSGGKDSTALALRMRETMPDLPVSYVCTPTGNELPEMIDHWKRLGEMLGSPILPVTSGYSLHGLVDRWNALPNDRQRWCTRVLKIEPYYRFLGQIAPVISYVGLRADEEGRNGMTFPELGDIQVKFPMKEWGWGERHVWDYLDAKGIKIPARTDCADCYHQTLGEWWRLWFDHPDIYAAAEGKEAKVSEHRGRECTYRNATRDTWPASLKDLRVEFEKGRIPSGTVRNDDLFQGGRRKTMCRVCAL